MKKTLLLAMQVCAFALACATAAHAQSSVTLYGLLDAGVSYSKNDGGPHPGAAPGNSTARFGNGLMQDEVVGIKGSADLGGGLRAIYNVEGEAESGAGAASQRGRNAGRVAYVGVGG